MLLTLPLIVALTLGAPDRSRTPWFLPRYALVGGYAGTGVFAPTVKLGWEVALVEQKTEFVAMLELGPAFGVIAPTNIRLFWEHTLLAGVGLRNRRGSRFQWGLSVMAGPVLHGATFNDGTLPDEHWNAVIEGRAEAGVDVGPVTLALFIGYQQPWFVPEPTRSSPFPSAGYVGGVAFGLLVNWR